jgi:signal transduction histidine kinase
MNRSTTFVIAIILVSYSLFFYFQISTEYRMKESMLQSAFQYQLQENSRLAAVAEERLNRLASGLKSASEDEVVPTGSGAYQGLLAEAADRFDGTGAEFLIVTDSYAIEVSLTIGEPDGSASTALDLAESGLLLSSDQKRFTISAGSIADKSVVFISTPLSGEDDTFLVGVIPASDILPEAEAAPYDIYFSNENVGSIQSLGADQGSLVTEAMSGPFAASLRLANEDLAIGDSTKPIVYEDSSGEQIVTAGTLKIDNGSYALYLTSRVEEHISVISGILFAQRIQTFSLLAGTSLMTIVLALFLSRNLRLDREVKARTTELVQSNVLIGEQKKKLEAANVQLKQLDVLKDQFISIASHELKNPIQPILMYTELAKRGTVSVERALDGIAVEARRLKKLANDILDVSRIESGGLAYKMERVKIKPIIDQVASSAQVSAAKGVRVSAEMEDPEVEIDADVDRITQVLQNIVSNAIKFTTDGSINIKVGKDQQSDKVLIQVSDTGGGIPSEILPNLFGKFATGSAGRKNTEGTGLGLYLSKAIVEAHGGTILATNKPGVGAVFTIVLPPVKESQAAEVLSRPGLRPQHSAALAGETN